jgi:hypothetical protein
MADEVIKRCDFPVGRGRNKRPHGEVIENGVPTRFRINGRDYEADLCAEHRAALDEALADFVAIARRSGTVLPRNSRGRAVMRAKGGVLFTTKDVRNWLEAEAKAGRGDAPSPSGRIPNADIDRYKEAHGLV